MAVILSIEAVDNYSREIDKTRRQINRINMQIAENTRQQVDANAEQRKQLQLIARKDRAERSVLIAKAQGIALDRKATADEVRAAEQQARAQRKAAADAERAAEQQARAQRKAAADAERMNREIRKTVQAASKARREAGLLAHEFDRFGNVVRKTNQSVQNSNKRFGALSRSLGAVKFALAGVAAQGVANAGRAMIQFSREAARASIQIDSYTRALGVLEGSARQAENRIRELQDLADEPGLRFRAAVEGALALKAVRIEGDLATRTLRELGNAAAFTGGEGEFQRGLLGLRQIAARGRISQEELNQLTENISVASTVLRNEFGTVLAEEIQENLDETGQSVNDFIETLISGFEKLERFPIDAPSVRLKNLSNSFFEFKAAVGDLFLPAVGAAATGLTSLLDSLRDGAKDVKNFFDVIDEEHRALLNASESARDFSVRLADINKAAGQQDAVSDRIQHLYRLRAAYRTEQSELSRSSQEYLKYAQQIQAVNTELETLRNIQGTAQTDNSAQLISIRTEALERANADIQRYTQLLSNARAVAVGDTNPAIQQLERSLKRSQETAAAYAREIDLLKNGFQDLTPAVGNATTILANYSLEIAKLQATAEDLSNAQDFQAAIAASNAYYNARIANAQTALAAETKGTEEYNKLETEIFQLRRQRLQAQQRLENENQQGVARTAQLRIDAASRARQAEVEGFQAAARAGNIYVEALRSLDSVEQRRSFVALVDRLQAQGQSFRDAVREAEKYIQIITAIPSQVSRADIEQGKFNETLGKTDTILDGLISRQTAYAGAIGATLTLVRAFQRAQAEIDDRLEAGQSRAEQREQEVFENPPTGRNLGDVRREAGEEGAEFFRRQFQMQERELERSLNRQHREYQRFYTRIGDLAVSAAFGQVESFAEAAKQFIIQATRDLVRLAITRQVTAAKEIAIDTAVTNARIANQRRLQNAITQTAAANQASAGIGGVSLPGLGSLSNFATGGGGALGIAGALFPTLFKNLFSGIGQNLIQPIAASIGGSEANSIGNIFIMLDDGTLRKVRNRQTAITKRNR